MMNSLRFLRLFSKLHHESEPASENHGAKSQTSKSKANLEGTVGTVAGKLGCKVGAGRELIIAAAARLTFVVSKDSYNRAELLEEAKTATAYYKRSVASNLSNTLNTLVKDGDFTEISQGVYSLSAPKREELEKRLAA